MKKIPILFLFMIVAISLCVISCNKDEDENDNPPTSKTPGITAKVGENDWNATHFTAENIVGTTTIYGESSDSVSITMTITNFEVGDHIIDVFGETNLAALTMNGITYNAAMHPEAGGKVTINEINMSDSLISGTFEFVGFDHVSQELINVTAGAFVDIPTLIEEDITIENMFEVDIDGNPFNAISINGSLDNNAIIIYAYNSMSESVKLYIDPDLPVGVYHFEDTFDIYGEYKNEYQTTMPSAYGTIEITEHNTNHNIIKGNFNFEAQETWGGESALLTNGYFEVNY